jgi:hypothetical protein
MVGGRRAAFMIPFFCFHFGMFMVVHLAFIGFVLAFAGDGLFAAGPPALSRFHVPWSHLALGVGAMLVGHGVSFVVHFVRGPERRVALQRIMMQPYGRILPMHVAIVVGSFPAIMLGEPTSLLVVLVLLKVAVDAGGHWFEHRLAARALESRWPMPGAAGSPGFMDGQTPPRRDRPGAEGTEGSTSSGDPSDASATGR